MTLYFYVRYFPPHQAPVQNGVIKAVHGLAAGLAAGGEAVTVLSEGPQAAIVQTAFGYEHRCFERAADRVAMQLAPDLRRFLQESMASQDLVILNGGFHLGVDAMARSLRAQGIPYVMAPHLSYDDAMFAKSRYRKWLYWYLRERHVLQLAAAIQVFDARQADCLRQRGITTPTLTVQNGFDPQTMAARSALRWRSGSTPAQLRFFGRLCTHTKGLDLLLQGFAALPESQTPAPELVMQGADGGDRVNLAQMARSLGVADRVQFRAADYHTPTAQLMAQADIVCLPSRSEGFGLAALEGMLAGRVLLVSAHAGIAQHVRDSGCGVVVEPNPAAIQAGLNQLLQCRDDWPAMGLRGRQQAIDHLPWSQIAQQLRPQYQALIAAPRSVAFAVSRGKWAS